jgi:hypothetical protein
MKSYQEMIEEKQMQRRKRLEDLHALQNKITDTVGAINKLEGGIEVLYELLNNATDTNNTS